MPRPPIRNPWLAWLVDTLERAGRTFLQGFLAVVTLDAIVAGVDLGLRDQLLAGLIAGVYAIATSIVAKPLASPSSASFLPTSIDPPTLAEYDVGELTAELLDRGVPLEPIAPRPPRQL